eukprot:4663423-Pleurochrysis_carterae.AAC.2
MSESGCRGGLRRVCLKQRHTSSSLSSRSTETACSGKSRSSPHHPLLIAPPRSQSRVQSRRASPDSGVSICDADLTPSDVVSP